MTGQSNVTITFFCTADTDMAMTVKRIVWKVDYEVGVDAIDNQHKQLFAMLDNLTKPDAEVRMLDLLLALGKYIEEHFAFAEDLMRKHAYPVAAA